MAAPSGGDEAKSPLDESVVVAVDLDEVIGQFVPELCKMHNERFGTSHTADDYFSYEFHHVWECSKEECQDRVDMFLAEYIPGLPVISGAKETLLRLKAKHRFRFVLVTSRQSNIEAETRAWLDKHYPEVFDSVVLGNHYGRTGVKRSKAEMCRELDVRVLIDDRVKYAKATTGAVETILLFGKYAWNKLSEEAEAALDDSVHRVANWDEVESLLVKKYVTRAGKTPIT